MAAVIPPAHSLGEKEQVSLSELSEYPFLMREKGSAGRELLDASFELLQITVKPRWQSTSTQAIVKAVSEGLGVSVLPWLLVRKDIEEGAGKRSASGSAHPQKTECNLSQEQVSDLKHEVVYRSVHKIWEARITGFPIFTFSL